MSSSNIFLPTNRIDRTQVLKELRYFVGFANVGNKSLEALGSDIGLVFVLDVLEEFLEGEVVGDAIEDLWIVVDCDPLDEALDDVLLIDLLHLPGSSGDLVELHQDAILLGKQLTPRHLPVLLVDHQSGVIDLHHHRLQYLEVVVEELVLRGVAGDEWLEEGLNLLLCPRRNVDEDVCESEGEVAIH